MFGHLFYHSVIRKYIVVFGTIFNELYIQREDSSGNTIDEFKVPLTYGPRDKMLARVEADAALNRPTAITLPRMSFELTSVTYDPTRKLNTLGRRVAATRSPGETAYAYNPVPYNLNFSLSIMVKNAEDGTRILEQILPFFTPDWNVTMNHVEGLESSHDVPIVLQSVGSEDQYTDNFESRRALIWTLDFVMKGYIYGPVRESQVISQAIGTFFNVDGDVEIAISNTSVEGISTVTVTPGLDDSGAPVYRDPNNAAASVTAISNFAVADITMTNKGNGYANATVTITAPAYTNATATAAITSNAVSGVTMTANGGYYISAPAVTFDVPQSSVITATGTVALTGNQIANATVSNTGTYYLTTPSVTVGLPALNAITATATANGEGGTINSVNITNNGSFYITAPVVTVGGVVATVVPVLTANITDGYVSGINIVTAGTFTGAPTIEIAAPTGTAADFRATANATITNNRVTAITIIDGGRYYDSNTATITVAAPTGTANDFVANGTAQLTNGRVTGILVTANGDFYTAAPNVSIAGVDSNTLITATATATIVGGRVDEITIANSGLGYITAPAVSISNADLNTLDRNSIASNTSYGYIVSITQPTAEGNT